ncbi:hypothetical protein ACIQC7_34780 [Kitasatospora sp. NPDC088556]|uniref:hypothetical protein n=1 Tax=Kitasatospora sp. NPDC088556 TaxID=3364076 RepID=UPI0037F30968
MTTTPAWAVYIEYSTTVPDDVHDELFHRLNAYGAAPTTSPTGNFAALIELEAPTAELADTRAREAVSAVLRRVHGSAPIAVIEVMSTEERDRRTFAPDIPDLTGVPGIAKILGVSPQAAHKRVASPEFKRHVPLATTIDGRPHYLVEHVQRYAAQRSPGRPRKTPEQ